MYTNRKELRAMYVISEAHLKEIIKLDPTFPKANHRQQFKMDEIQHWFENTVTNTVKMMTTLPLGTPTKGDLNIIGKAEVSFLHDYLYKVVPGLKTFVEEEERQDLRRGFYGFRTRERWVTASHGVIGPEAWEALKRFDAYPSKLEKFEGLIYARFLRSLGYNPNQNHADFNTYMKAFIFNDLKRKCNVDMAESAKKKYGAEASPNLAVGSSYWMA